MVEKEIYLRKENGKELYLHILEKNIEAPNVIFIMTPMGNVKKFNGCYVPLAEAGCNIFAVDLSGVGNSKGDMKEFSLETITDDINTVVNYINAHFSDDIHLFGATGTGGILAQAYMGSVNRSKAIKSFSQTGVAIYGDMSIMPNSSVYKLLNKCIPLIKKLTPNLKIKFKIPKYDGFNAERERQWYEKFQEENPGALDTHISFVATLLGIFFNGDSPIKNTHDCPTLLVTAKHDRFYYQEYVNRYFETLDQPKKLYEINDSHLVFAWNSEEICREVSKWVFTYSKSQVPGKLKIKFDRELEMITK